MWLTNSHKIDKDWIEMFRYLTKGRKQLIHKNNVPRAVPNPKNKEYYSNIVIEKT